MSDYGSLYIIGTSYHSERGIYEVNVGYMTKDEGVKGRFMTINILVNVPNHKNKNKIKELALSKAKKVLELASQTPVEE
jgi:hypothetical protein